MPADWWCDPACPATLLMKAEGLSMLPRRQSGWVEGSPEAAAAAPVLQPGPLEVKVGAAGVPFLAQVHHLCQRAAEESPACPAGAR